MEEITQQPRQRRRKQLAPWERTLRKIWPTIQLFLVGSIGICLVVLLISCAVAMFA